MSRLRSPPIMAPGFLLLFSVDERLELGNRANGKKISDVPFRTVKEEYHWRKSTISERIFRKMTVPFDFQPKFPDFLAKWRAPLASCKDALCARYACSRNA